MSDVDDEVARRIAEYAKSGDDSLDLSNLALHKIPNAVRDVAELISLDIRDNSIRELPDWIAELKELETLYADDNQIKWLPISLRSLPKLRRLAIGRNPLTLPEWLGDLRGLTFLALPGLHLTQVPEFVRRLTGLGTLYLADNRLVALPVWLREVGVDSLYVGGNPALGLPAEVVDTNDADRILDYYFRVAAPSDRQPLNEFKLVLVGRGGVGKTTLVHKLTQNEYKEFKRTPGIKITKWPVTIDGDSVRAHVWDFGGQEIMHGTHRFFMTERALYLVLISGREGTEDHDAEYWLSLIRSFAGEVPVIVLLHKWKDYPFELNQELLREKFGANVTFLETDSTGHNIEALKAEICNQASKLSGLKAAWPSEWRRIKEVLPAKRKSWLTFDDFRKFCEENGVPETHDQEMLAESLHDLGLMLSYRRDETLRHFGVLNPQWVTRGIYEMLNSRALKDAGGKFTVKSFGDVLAEKQYPKDLHPFLLALMRKFQLCHPLDTKGNNYLIPELLTKEEPKADPDFAPGRSLGFVYKYDAVLPEGLLPRFIVETYVMREPKRAWRTGVILERANCRALVRGDVQGRRVDIRVAGVGNGRRELLGIIREHFERIHKSYERLPVTELVPIPSHPDAPPVEHDLLLLYERFGREQITVNTGHGLLDLSVKDLLDGVDLPGARRRTDPIPVFISYAHKDAAFLDQLKSALVVYERNGDLTLWSDSLIEAGDQWESEITRNLDRARIVILLLSNDFFRSSYIEKEIAYAAEREKSGECTIVPVVVRDCRFDKHPIGKIQAILPFGKPIDFHDKTDAAWVEVTKELDRVIGRIRA